MDKALDRMGEKIKSFKSYAEYTNWYFNNYMIAGTVYNIAVIGIIFIDIAFFKKILSVTFEICFSSSFWLEYMSCACQEDIISC